MVQIIRDTDAFHAPVLAGASCAFGVFDGLHRGHQFLFDCAHEKAHVLDCPFVIITFDIDPDEVFRASSLKKILTNERRISLLAETGADAVVCLPFTREFAAQEPLDFLNQVFGDYVPAALFVGRDFGFGNRAKGKVSTLETWGSEHGMQVFAQELFQFEGASVTATRIRGLLSEGQVEAATRLLNKNYTLSGEVIRGRGEGAHLGFATANLAIPAMMLCVGEGVYACYADIDGVRYKAAVSIGVSPTFENAHANCEAHILHYDENLYGKRLTLSFVHYLRPMMKFRSQEELVETVQGNIAWTDAHL